MGHLSHQAILSINSLISRKLSFYERYLRVPYLIGQHLFVKFNASKRFQVITEDKCETLLVYVLN